MLSPDFEGIQLASNWKRQAYENDIASGIDESVVEVLSNTHDLERSPDNQIASSLWSLITKFFKL